jgi:hypothetical protein
MRKVESLDPPATAGRSARNATNIVSDANYISILFEPVSALQIIKRNFHLFSAKQHKEVTEELL